jgi:hypothetical protein
MAAAEICFHWHPPPVAKCATEAGRSLRKSFFLGVLAHLRRKSVVLKSGHCSAGWRPYQGLRRVLYLTIANPWVVNSLVKLYVVFLGIIGGG